MLIFLVFRDSGPLPARPDRSGHRSATCLPP